VTERRLVADSLTPWSRECGWSASFRLIRSRSLS
jgi:hypothetical protein